MNCLECDAGINIPGDAAVGEIVSCPECGADFEIAKKEGIDLGKGDPYNRLRYYTKMGWLPHMTRKSNETGDIEGHYPIWVIDTLKNIHTLKNKGISNEQIEQKVKTQNNLKRTLMLFLSKENQRKIIITTVATILALIILAQISVIRVLDSSRAANQISYLNYPNNNTVIESNTGLLLKNTKSVIIKTTNAKVTNKISITFKDDYSPASRYWVTHSKDQNSFILETDAPVASDAGFYWFISN